LRLIEHCALETYSVLTRLPPPHGASGELVLKFLAERFPRPFLRMREDAYRSFIMGLTDKEVKGGAAYGMTIRNSGIY
jgi:hypothetical protein